MQRLEKVDRTLSEYKAGVEVVKEIQETRELLTLIEGNIHGRHVAGCLRDAMESKDIEAVRGQIEEFVKVFKRYGG
jgi:DNA-binding FrmR family transcriptional regulator